MTVLVLPAVPDYEKFFYPALEAKFPVLAQAVGGQPRTGTETPDNVQERITPTVPFVRYNVRSGRTGQTQLELPLEVDVFSKSRHLSRDLAFAIETWLVSGRHRWSYTEVVDGTPVNRVAMVDRIICTSSPDRVPWPDATVDRFFAAYEISTRRV